MQDRQNEQSVVVRLLTILLCTVFGTGEAQAGRCPAGMVWGGGRCEYAELCQDGKPPKPGQACFPPIASVPERSEQTDSVPRETVENPVRFPELEPCQEATVFFLDPESDSPVAMAEKASQKLLVSGGPLVFLLERYRRDVESAGGEIDYQKLEVIYYRSSRLHSIQGDVDVKMSLRDLFRGFTYEHIWQREVKGILAEWIENAEEIALKLRADLVCGAKDERFTY